MGSSQRNQIVFCVNIAGLIIFTMMVNAVDC
jgi:hypothetical protein